MKHTPGPWTIGGRYTHKTTLINANGESIASGGNNRSVVGEELEASLRLASAAPDMLYALRDALRIVDAYRRCSLGDGDITAANIRFVIRQATGEDA